MQAITVYVLLQADDLKSVEKNDVATLLMTSMVGKQSALNLKTIWDALMVKIVFLMLRPGIHLDHVK